MYNTARPWTHDHMITSNYFITFESSIQYDPKELIKGNVFSYQPNHKFRIGLNLKNATNADSMQWFTFNSSYGFLHVSNAWEETANDSGTGTCADTVVIWMPMSTDFDMQGNSRNKWYMHEIRINIHTGSSTITCIDDTQIVEFPRIHPSYLSQKCKYSYAAIMHVDGLFNGVVKYDHDLRVPKARIQLPPGYICGEVIPIPKEGLAGTACDGVYLGTFVYNTYTKLSEFHVYDGTSMSSTPVVVLDTAGKRVPNGFHAEWMSEESLQKHILAHS